MGYRPRSELQALLRNIPGVTRVYFQPPSTVNMSYPCIVYERSKIYGEHANNLIYKNDLRYTVTVIYTDPDSSIPIEVAKIPTAQHNSHFVSENLYHDVFTIIF